ncbi:Yju2p/cwf16-like Zn finger-containing protein [Cryptosporidium canis]|uniref:Yju2p/cwf16-like Zn finger-containing protein n=1 Tax=Cryptosporidium canis TaxID=195482 RepID=A0A9D5DMI9_9CRYT|nr:Yju2p/cwf16-like Zn finger-containing protein [Cryptosporidium canis]
MSERKVLNRYFPPDFDPKKLEEGKRLFKKSKPNRNHDRYKKKKFLNIRMLYPFTIRCNVCGFYHYVGTKFNSKVERVQNESYLGIPIWRFYGRCTQCGNIIIFKTDPKSGDYILESGAIRNFVMKIKETNNRDDDDIESKVINSVLESKSLEELDIVKNLNKRLMNREVTELNALKHILESGDTENLLSAKATEKNSQISDNELEDLIFDTEKHIIKNSVMRCIECYELSRTYRDSDDYVIGSNHRITDSPQTKAKNNSACSIFDYYDSESEQD